MSTAPQTLPANFTGWDKPAAGSQPPATLPANFSQWDDQKPAQQPAAAPDSAASRFGSNLASGAGVMSKEDTKNFFLHPIDTLKKSFAAQGQLAEQSKQDFQNKDYVRGVTHAIEYMIPFMGPNIAQAGKQLEQGDIAGGVGRTLGAAIPIVAGSPDLAALKAKIPVGTLPEKMYQSALKPSTTLATNEVQSIVKTGLENKIPVSADGAAKLNSLVTDLGDKVKQQIQGGSKTGMTIDPTAVAARADQVKSRFTTQVNPDADLNAIDASKQEFLKNNPNAIPADQAQALKQGTYAQLKGRAYGELRSATIESQKALARGIKEELETQFPEIKGLNAQQQKLYGLDDALERAVRRIDNRDIFSLGGKVAGAGGAALGGAPGGIAGFIMHHVITSPEIQSKLAIALSAAGKGGIPFPSAMARVGAYASALGQSASQPSDSQAQQ